MANSTTVYVGQDGRNWVDVTENKTLAAADQGIVQNVITDAITVTLPATVVGMHYIVRNGGVKSTGGAAGTVSNGTCLVTIAVASGDGFTGNAFTAAINKKALNTKATSQVGDYLEVNGSGTNAATAWNITEAKGIWAREG